MSNVRRQTLIIAVLIVLIACAGWFAKEVNDRPTTKTTGKEATNEGTQQNQEAAVFFSKNRISRQSERSSTMENLQSLIQSTEASAETKSEASAKYMELLTRGDQENEVEIKAKNDGYADALCFITDTGVELYVKIANSLTKEQAFALQEIIVRTTGIAPSNIVVKPIVE
jgi:stage III sporulation protein AH